MVLKTEHHENSMWRCRQNAGILPEIIGMFIIKLILESHAAAGDFSSPTEIERPDNVQLLPGDVIINVVDDIPASYAIVKRYHYQSAAGQPYETLYSYDG